MRLTNDYLKGFKIGWEFEFFSKKIDREIIKELSTILGKQIIIPKELDGLNNYVVKPKTNFTPTDKIYKLVPDFSGGPDMHELVTGPLPFYEARIQAIRVLKWIQSNGWTTDKTGIHINMSYDDEMLGINMKMSHIDRLKFCLSFDESFIYKKFPKRRDNVYAKSIKHIYPVNKFMFNTNEQIFSLSDYITPNTKYYGVNFTKLKDNYLEFRYVGGKNYDSKIDSILDVCDHIASNIYNIVTNHELNDDDVGKLKDILNKHKKIVTSFSDLKQFIINYPNIKLMVDLDGKYQVLEVYYVSVFRDILYDLIVKGNLKKGLVNYDKDVGKIQVSSSEIKKGDLLSNIEFVNSDLDGIFNNCTYYNCKIKDSHIVDSKIIKGNKLERCKITKSPINSSNELDYCYIDNKDITVNGKISNSIIRHGKVSILAKLIDTIKIK